MYPLERESHTHNHFLPSQLSAWRKAWSLLVVRKEVISCEHPYFSHIKTHTHSHSKNTHIPHSIFLTKPHTHPQTRMQRLTTHTHTHPPTHTPTPTTKHPPTPKHTHTPTHTHPPTHPHTHTAQERGGGGWPQSRRSWRRSRGTARAWGGGWPWCRWAGWPRTRASSWTSPGRGSRRRGAPPATWGRAVTRFCFKKLAGGQLQGFFFIVQRGGCKVFFSVRWAVAKFFLVCGGRLQGFFFRAVGGCKFFPVCGGRLQGFFQCAVGGWQN